MIVCIKYFGKLTDITKTDYEELNFITEESFGAIEKFISKKYLQIKEEVFISFLNNKKIEDKRTLVKDGDQICLMPPFSGG